MAWSISLLVYAVVQFIAFMLVLVATPIGMFRLRPTIATISPNQCITLWGHKLNCSTVTYRMSSDELWLFCPPRHNRFRLAQAFVVVSILVYGTAFVLGVIQLFCCTYLRFVCLALNVVGAITLCVVWVAMVVTYNRREGPRCLLMESLYTYGPGVVLLILAWVLDLLNIAPLLLPFPDSFSDESGKGTESRG